MSLVLLLSLSARAAAPMDRAEEAFDAVDATDAQRTTARALLEDALPELAAFREEARAVRERMSALFLEPEIDRDAVEATRIDAVDLFDRCTSTALSLAIDLAGVFTPEQRAVLQDLRRERMKERWAAWRD